MTTIRLINPITGVVSTVTSNEEEKVHAVNAAGMYIGLVTKGTEYFHIAGPPTDPKLKWSFATQAWEHVPMLLEEIEKALLEIDNITGATRLRYITEVPGQQATYLLKMQEAEAYLKDNTVIGPYLAVEADLLGLTVHQAAVDIAYTSYVWNNILGPKIEGIRRKGKMDVSNATTLEELAQRKAATIAELAIV